MRVLPDYTLRDAKMLENKNQQFEVEDYGEYLGVPILL